MSMLTAKQLLMEKEVLIGEYNVEIARWSNNQWHSTVPPLYAILTDLRLILQRQALKTGDPAIIPTQHIIYLRPFMAGNRSGVVLTLKNDQRIALFIPNIRKDEIMRNLRTVAINAIRGEKRYDIQFDATALSKIIDHIKQI
ncbi:MAG: hypothetical protein KJ043_04780 [Anaerolineae bacterium]|nr:hypothetical protein [Anaerolineae bacterium]